MKPLPVPVSIQEVDKLIEVMSEMRKRRKELDNALDAAKDALKAYMEANKLEAFKTAKSAVTYVKGKKTRFDAKRFKEERPKLYEKYLSTEEFEQLRFDVEEKSDE